MLAFIVVNASTPLYRSEARILIEGRDNIYLRPEADKSFDRSVIDQVITVSDAVTHEVVARELARPDRITRIRGCIELDPPDPSPPCSSPC